MVWSYVIIIAYSSCMSQCYETKKELKFINDTIVRIQNPIYHF